MFPWMVLGAVAPRCCRLRCSQMLQYQGCTTNVLMYSTRATSTLPKCSHRARDEMVVRRLWVQKRAHWHGWLSSCCIFWSYCQWFKKKSGVFSCQGYSTFSTCLCLSVGTAPDLSGWFVVNLCILVRSNAFCLIWMPFNFPPRPI